jgi:hypothetical protein
MWVFIRPRVVRSANGERLNCGEIHVQFIVSMGPITFWTYFRQPCKPLDAWRRVPAGVSWGFLDVEKCRS